MYIRGPYQKPELDKRIADIETTARISKLMAVDLGSVEFLKTKS